LFYDEVVMTEKVVIIGSGPAAYTAALYTARAGLQPFVFSGFKSGGMPGGQLMITGEVENYPGFPMGISGPELMKAMEEQVRRFGVRIVGEDVLEVDLSKSPFVVRGSSTNLQTHSLIIATGANAKRLEITGGTEYWNRGISACAVCDGALPLFRNQVLAVVGGGDTACEEANYLTRFGSKVYLLVRKGELRASKIMQERVFANNKVEVLFHHEVIGAEGQVALGKLQIKNNQSNQTRSLEAKGLFYAIGHEPNTGFLKGQLPLDETGYIKVTPGSSYTPIPGVFAAGDVCDKKYRQAVTAAGMGCMAALDAEHWLSHRAL
jgi:thioredoxin reductase (NADPH)